MENDMHKTKMIVKWKVNNYNSSTTCLQRLTYLRLQKNKHKSVQLS